MRRFLGFLGDSGSVEDSGVRPSSAEALAPPSAEVRREMDLLRAELDAAAAAEAEQIAAAELAEAEQIAAADLAEEEQAAAAGRMAADAAGAPADEPGPAVP
jgi:hypothetical protein